MKPGLRNRDWPERHGLACAMAQRAPTTADGRAGVVRSVRAVLLSPLGIACFVAGCFVAADLRRLAQVEPGYGFYRWNLGLALVPLLLAYALSWAARREITRLALPMVALAWILFLPNAPYLVTDLVHLDEGVNGPNMVVLVLLAITGLLIGVKSVQLVQRVVERLLGVSSRPAGGARHRPADGIRRVPRAREALEQLDRDRGSPCLSSMPSERCPRNRTASYSRSSAQSRSRSRSRSRIACSRARGAGAAT